MNERHLYQCSVCGTSGADHRKQGAFDCHHCGGHMTMEHKGSVTVEDPPEVKQYKNTVTLALNALDELEELHKSGGDIAPAIYNLRCAIEDL